MTSSVSAFEGQIGQAAYSASKGGVASLTLPLARELGQHGIRVVSIAPGVFDTPMMQAAPDKVRQSLIEQIPFPHRFGHADEFASLVCHVFENNMLNGCVLRLDGADPHGSRSSGGTRLLFADLSRRRSNNLSSLDQHPQTRFRAAQ